MATNNAPKHDFAPAWLKIPNQDNSKPSGSKQGGKRFPTGQSGKFRHHSVDDDYYAYTYGPCGYYNGYGGYPNEKYGMHYSSQPSLIRSPSQRDSKYQHPHARYGGGPGGNGQPMNPGYPQYYDFLPQYEYYNSDQSYYANYPPARNGSTKKSYYEKEGRSNSKDGKDKDDKKDGDKEKPFNDEFPSLNGGMETPNTKGSKQANGTGVWDNPPNSKTSALKESADTSQLKVLRDTSIYKNLVPSKSGIPRRPARMNGSYSSREQGPYSGLKPPTPTSAHSPGMNKEGSSQSTTPPMDILNTRFVTQPKTLSDNKKVFLKALRQEDNEKQRALRKSSEGELVNGLDSLDIEEDTSMLSSSLEAEQRLLREMGWNEADQEDYVITEDDMKEFQTLSKQMPPQRNGVIPRTIPKVWSPKHIPLYQPNVNELNETLSSDSDSDDAGN